MPVAGQTITIRRANLDGGINDVWEWDTVSRRKNGGSWVPIGSYNLVTSGHVVPADETVEGSVDVFNFAYSTDIPEDAETGDTYEYQFENSVFGLTRVTGEYETVEYEALVGIGSVNISTSIMI